MSEKTFKTIFSIADIPFVLCTTYPVCITEGFVPFLTGKEENGIIIEFYELEQMNPLQGKLVFYTTSFAVYEDESGYYRIFHDHKFTDKKLPYAMSRVYPNSIEKVWYQRESAPLFAESHNIFSHIAFEELLVRRDAMILHSSFIDTVYGGILFTGPSGIGKSTQADLWIKYRTAELINGDRSIIRKIENEWRAYGSPYAGSSRCYVNKSGKIRAIIVLEQAAECRLQRMRPAKAFVRIYSGLIVNNWNTVYIDKISKMAAELVNDIPIYLFECVPEEEAVELLSNVLEEET